MKRKPVSEKLALSLDNACQTNPWICDGGLAFGDGLLLESDYKFSFSQIDTLEELKVFFNHGNWAIRTGIVYHDLAFVNQVNGGDEWFTLKRFDDEWVDFDSISFRFILHRGDDEFERCLAALEEATHEQCRRRIYNYNHGDSNETDVLRDLFEVIEVRIAPVQHIVETIGVNRAKEGNPAFADFTQLCFARFSANDWGDICQEDRESNDTQPDYKLASYKFPTTVTVEGENCLWLIYDGTAITLLFPSEY